MVSYFLLLRVFGCPVDEFIIGHFDDLIHVDPSADTIQRVAAVEVDALLRKAFQRFEVGMVLNQVKLTGEVLLIFDLHVITVLATAWLCYSNHITILSARCPVRSFLLYLYYTPRGYEC